MHQVNGKLFEFFIFICQVDHFGNLVRSFLMYDISTIVAKSQNFSIFLNYVGAVHLFQKNTTLRINVNLIIGQIIAHYACKRILTFNFICNYFAHCESSSQIRLVVI